LGGCCASGTYGLHQVDELRVRGGDGQVVAEPEILMYANQDLLQLDNLRLQVDPRNVVAMRVGYSKFAVCAVVCCLDLSGCAAYKFVFSVAVVPGSLVEAPTHMASDRFDDV
jgi:hypothetical protein